MLRHKSSWMRPVTATNSLPVLFRAFSVHAPLCPSGWPPQNHVSIFLASPAMTQHWLSTEKERAPTHAHTLPLLGFLLGNWSSLLPWFSLPFLLSYAKTKIKIFFVTICFSIRELLPLQRCSKFIHSLLLLFWSAVCSGFPICVRITCFCCFHLERGPNKAMFKTKKGLSPTCA